MGTPAAEGCRESNTHNEPGGSGCSTHNPSRLLSELISSGPLGKKDASRAAVRSPLCTTSSRSQPISPSSMPWGWRQAGPPSEAPAASEDKLSGEGQASEDSALACRSRWLRCASSKPVDGNAVTPTAAASVLPHVTPDDSSPGGGPPCCSPCAFSSDSFEWEEWRGDWPLMHHAIAGSFAGVMEHLAMYPVDTLKTRMQAFRGPPRPSSHRLHAAAASGSAQAGPYDGRYSGSRRCSGGLNESVGAQPAASDAAKARVRMERYPGVSSWEVAAASSSGGCGFRSSSRASAGSLSERAAGVALRGGVPRPSGGVVASVVPPLGPLSKAAAAEVRSSAATERKLPSWQRLRSGGGGRLRQSVAAVSGDASNSTATRCLAGPLVLQGPTAAGSGVASGLRGVSSSAAGLGNAVQQTLGRGDGCRLSGRLGLLSGLRAVYAEGGFRGLYRGAGAVVAGCVPAHACYFMSYEAVKERMKIRARARQQQQQQKLAASAAANGGDSSSVTAGAAATPTGCVSLQSGCRTEPTGPGQCSGEVSPETHGPWLTHGELLACGVCATMSHDLILTPVDVVKQRMQLGCFRSLGDCVTATLRREGHLAFVRSLPVSLLLNLPHGATLVYTNETLKGHLEALAPFSPHSLPLYFFCAGVSGGVAGLISNPLDVVKTRLQTQDCAIRESRAFLAGVKEAGSCKLGPCTPKYQSLLGTIRTIWLEEGLQGFWRGVSSRVCLSIPATAICWGSYETFKFLWHASAGGH
ncbi:uncharacterized protein LOC34618690 [Cyclospora cayetanensis]|uniref:Uncharacterized protein LOC34618690 n=1 Tax=Cyclospora cayetanensis TaxID=88456 RepID=A0A6P6S222_9EIME|nr:uncharacterized protein LOC34618690 [Cyclospora cayetanensis]